MNTGEQLSFVEALERAFRAFLAGAMNTCMPGIVEEYDSATKKARVTPAISNRYIDGVSFPFKPIDSVPVMWPRTGSFILHAPLKKGDSVLLVFSQKALDPWLNKGGMVEPADPRLYDLTDAIAIPGLFSFKDTAPDSGNNDDVEIVLENANRIIIKANGDIEIGKQSLKKLVTESFQDIFNNHVHNFTAAPSGAFSTSTPASVAPTLYPAPVPPSGALAMFGSQLGSADLTSKTEAE